MAMVPAGAAQAAGGHAPAVSRCSSAHSHDLLAAPRHAGRKRVQLRVCGSHAVRHTTAGGTDAAGSDAARPSSAAGRQASSAPAVGSSGTVLGSQSGSLLPLATGACDGAPLTTPFAPFGDSNLYKLVPGGNFENGTSGWTLGGGARVVSGNESFSAAGTGSNSLLLPAGASVLAPASCVNASYPSLRLFAKTNSLLSTVAVSLQYSNVLGIVSVPVGVIAVSPNWQPTLPMLTASAVAGLVSNGSTSVAIRFTALTGSTQIDDVFIDPRMRY